MLTMMLRAILSMALLVASTLASDSKFVKIQDQLPVGSEVTSMFTDGSTLYASLANSDDPALNGAYSFDGNAWKWLMPKPNKYGMKNIIILDGQIFVIGHRDLYAATMATPMPSSWTRIPRPANADISIKSFKTDGKDLYVLFDTSDFLLMKKYNVATSFWEDIPAASRDVLALPRHKVSDYTVDDAGAIYVSFTWQFRDTLDPATATALGAVYMIANGQAVDITGGTGGYSVNPNEPKRPIANPGALDMGDLTGYRYGPMGGIEYDYAAQRLFASTEQGIHVWDGMNWNLFKSQWGNTKLQYSGGSVVSISGRSTSGFYVFTGDEMRNVAQGDVFFSCKHSSLSRVAVLGTKVYAVSDGKWELEVCTWQGSEPKKLYVIDYAPAPLVPTTDVAMPFASYLSTSKSVAPTSTLAKFKNATFVIQASNTDSPSLELLDTVTGSALSLAFLASTVEDMSITNDRTKIAVCGDFGVTVYEIVGDSVSVVWSAFGSFDRVDIAQSSAAVVALNKSSKIMTVFDEAGTILRTLTMSHSYVEDVAYDATRSQVIVTGFDNRRNCVAAQNQCFPVQVAYVKGYSVATGDQIWRTFTHPTDDLDNDMADTRGYRVEMGQDGSLLFLGESAGGNTIFRWDGKTLGETTWVITDKWSHPYNSKSAHMAYVGKIDPSDGILLGGTFYFPRIPSKGDVSNTNRVGKSDVTSLADGTIVFSCASNFIFSNRELQKINGTPIGEYAGSDGMVVVMTSDFQRVLNTAPSSYIARSKLNSVDAMLDGATRKLLFAGSSERGLMMTTANGKTLDSAVELNEDAAQGYTGVFDL